MYCWDTDLVTNCTGMRSVAVQHLGEHADNREVQSALWTLPALEALLFVLTNDGSVRMRRAAMQAASVVKVTHLHDQLISDEGMPP